MFEQNIIESSPPSLNNPRFAKWGMEKEEKDGRDMGGGWERSRQIDGERMREREGRAERDKRERKEGRRERVRGRDTRGCVSGTEEGE